MFMWKLLFTLLLIYQGIIFSVKDRYFYLLPLLFSVVMMGLALYLVTTHVFVSNTLSPLAYATLVLASLGIGFLLRQNSPLLVDKKRRLLHLQGQYRNLVPTFSLLGINYYLGYLRLTQKDFFTTVSLECDLLLMGFVLTMGVWIVMNSLICYRYWRSPSTPIVIPV